MRIAFVVHGVCPPAVEELAAALVRARHAVCLVGDAAFPEFGRRPDGVERIVLQPSVQRAGAAGALGRAAGPVLRTWQPDVVHASGFVAGVAALVARDGQGPVVLSVPGLAATQRRMGAASGDLGARMLMERRVLDLAAMVIADSAGQAMEMLRAGVSPARVVTAPPGVDWHRYPVTPLPRRRSDRAWCLLHAGGSRPESGVEDVMAAISGLANVHLTVAGAEDADMDRLRESARRWRLQDRIAIHGRVAASALPGMYVSADAVVVPPRQLSSGRLALEGLSSGRPVIATACGAIVDIIEDGVTGRLAPPRDPRALAEAVHQTMTAPRALLEDAAARGVTCVRQEHAWQQRVPFLVTVYESVLVPRDEAPVLASA